MQRNAIKQRIEGALQTIVLLTMVLAASLLGHVSGYYGGPVAAVARAQAQSERAAAESTRPSDEASTVGTQGAAADPAIGEACDPKKHGWRPPEDLVREVRRTSESGSHVVPEEIRNSVSLPEAERALDTTELPVGRKYCLVGPAYPRGYMTSNCTTDRSCADDASCVEGLCRKLCVQDKEWAEPSVCSGTPEDAKRYCLCATCVRRSVIQCEAGQFGGHK